jgi:hypothetical protein
MGRARAELSVGLESDREALPVPERVDGRVLNSFRNEFAHACAKGIEGRRVIGFVRR